MLPVERVGQPLVFSRLVLNGGFDDLFIRPHCRDKIAVRPELMPYQVFRLVGDEPMDVIRHQLAGFDPTVLLRRQPVKHRLQSLPEYPIQHFLAVFGRENYVVFAVPPSYASGD